MAEVHLGNRMIRLYMFMKLIFLYLEPEIFLKNKKKLVKDRCISPSLCPW